MFDGLKQKVKGIAIKIGIPIVAVVAIVGGFIGGIIESSETTTASAYSGDYSDYDDNEETFSGDTYEYLGKTYKLYDQKKYTDSYGGGDKTISSSGCGVTSIAICISADNKDETPATIAKKCSEKYGYTYDDYFESGSIFESYLNEYGYTGKYFGNFGSDALNNIKNHLQSGNPVILNVQNGTLYLDDGSKSYYEAHFITLLGMDNNEHIFVGDPYGNDAYTSMDNIKNSGPVGYCLVSKK